MRSRFLPILFAVPLTAFGQATPTATAPQSSSGLNLPSIDGRFEYGVTAAELFQNGFSKGSGVSAQTSLSGTVTYSNRNQILPLSLVYTGGIQIANQSSFSNTVFQSFAVTQGYVTKNWVFNIADVLTYLPQSPTTGLSGIPGTGDIGFVPVQSGFEPSQDILTIGNSRLSNAVSGNAERHLDAFTSLSVGGTYGILRFEGNNILDSTQYGGNAAINRRLDARSSVTVSGSYTTFRYNNLGLNASFISKGLNLGFERQLTRNLSVNASAGPQWISGSQALSIPSRLTYGGSASVNYSIRIYNANVGYSRGVNGGAGVQPGGITDSLVGVLQRPFGPDWLLSLDGGYARTQGLSNTATPLTLTLLGLTSNGNYNSEFGGAQVSRRLTRALSAYGSYTLMNQSHSASTASPYALNGYVQTFAIGVSYFPRSLHLGQF